jgi:DNA helicase-2/ATP-dependent DNA helicase PcrA
MILSMISRAKNEMKGPEAYDEQAYDINERTVARVFRGYQALLKVQNAVDFDDLLLKVVELFERSKKTLEKYQKRFQHVLIDEYQDTNAAQYRIARALASGHRNICATGDPDQSIYSWRGADIRNILSFEEDFPGATVIKLEENFRSTGHILAAADMLIKNNTMRKERDLFTAKPEGEPVVVCALSDEQEEATYVAAEIARASGEGVPLRDIAVMYRVNALSRNLEEAMRAAGIPYTIIGTVEFYRRKEIKDLLAYMKLTANPLDDVSFGRIINVPARGIGLRTIERLKAFASLHSVPMLESARRVKEIDAIKKPAVAKVQRFTSIMQRLKKHSDDSAADAVRAVLEETNYLAFLDRDKSEEGLQRRENVGALVSAAFEFDQLDAEGGLRGFLEQVALVSDMDSWDDAEERITLLTLHSAKGLEFRTAFIVGVEESLFPHVRSSETVAGLEEERRLAYVGITRAEERLYLCYTHFRTQFGRTMRCTPSRFLAELDPDACEFRVSRTQRTPSRLATLDFGDDDPDDIEVSLELEDFDEPVIEYDDIGSNPPPDNSVFRAGVIVRHSRFGVGQILELSGSGSDLRARESMMEEQNQGRIAAAPRPRFVFIIALFGVVLGPMMLSTAISLHLIICRNATRIIDVVEKNQSNLNVTAEQVKTPPSPEKNPETGEYSNEYTRYQKLLEFRKVWEARVLENRDKLERIRVAGYEIYFAFVIDTLLILGGIGLIWFRRWGQKLVLLAILLTPFYGAYFLWQLHVTRDHVPWPYYLFFLAAIPLAWAFCYLLSKRVRRTLLPVSGKPDSEPAGG